MWITLLVLVLAFASYRTVIIESQEIRGWLGAAIAAVFLLGLQTIWVWRANRIRPKTQDKLVFFDLIVTEDNRYSLSRLQIYLWTIWAVIAFTQAVFVTLKIPQFPYTLAALMGINGFTTVIATAITPEKTARSDDPNFFRDIFLDKQGTLDLPRAQMLIWTVVILAAHIIFFEKELIAGNIAEKGIPDVPEGLLILMGVSNGAYLGMKKAEDIRKTEAAVPEPTPPG